MPTSTRQLVLLVATSLSSLAAGCVSDHGQTPSCIFNVGPNGIIAEDSGCEQVALCTVNPANPAACCVDSSGNPLTGNDLVNCLYGYGVDSSADAGT
jgi:hypothetical protein